LDNRRGEWWLGAQLALIAAHLLPVWPVPAFWGLVSWPRLLFGFGLLLLAFGLIRAVQALLSLGASLSPLPVPKQHNQLIRTGVYGHCRHPMYQAVLLCSLGVVVATGSLFHLGLFLVLAMVLRGKARFEELALRQLHPDYVAYAAITPAIVRDCPGLDWRCIE
jgi:protein-S-isoprenylcysteine O-methyltransferase Ste14